VDPVEEVREGAAAVRLADLAPQHGQSVAVHGFVDTTEVFGQGGVGHLAQFAKLGSGIPGVYEVRKLWEDLDVVHAIHEQQLGRCGAVSLELNELLESSECLVDVEGLPSGRVSHIVEEVRVRNVVGQAEE